MLNVESIHSYYDKSHVLEGVSLQVGDGELVTLLGRNVRGRSVSTASNWSAAKSSTLPARASPWYPSIAASSASSASKRT